MVASHVTAMERLALSFDAQMVIDPLMYSAATTTWVNNKQTAVITADSGTETMVATTTVGLDLIGVSGVSVILKTSAARRRAGSSRRTCSTPRRGPGRERPTST